MRRLSPGFQLRSPGRSNSMSIVVLSPATRGTISPGLERVEVISGYAKHSEDLWRLPASEQVKIGESAWYVADSYRSASGLKPIVEIHVVGHADQDWSRGFRDLSNEAVKSS